MIALATLLVAAAVAMGSTGLRDFRDDNSVESTPPTARHVQRSDTAASPPPEVFVPSVKVSADKPVSFPSDI